MSDTVTDPNADFLPPIPPAVRRQAERAAELFKTQAPAPTEPDPGPTPAPTPAPAPAPAAVQPAPTPAHAAEPDYEQLYKTLKGRWDAQVPQMQAQLRLQGEELENMRATVAQLNSMPTATPARAAGGEITAEDKEAYGDELIVSARRWARAEMQGEIDALKAEVATVKGTTAQVQVATAQQVVQAALDGAVPDWRKIDYMQDFHNWLALIDPFAGRSRHAMLNEAYKRGESARVISFYEAFQRGTPAATPSPGSTPPAPTPGPAVPLADLAAPGAARHAGGGAPAEERPIWTQKEIAAFYRDKRNGVFTGRQAEADRIEQDIIAAGREGRVH